MPMQKIVTVQRFKVQRSGVRTKKGVKTRSPRQKCSFSKVIANLSPNFGLGLKIHVPTDKPVCPNALRGREFNLEPLSKIPLGGEPLNPLTVTKDPFYMDLVPRNAGWEFRNHTLFKLVMRILNRINLRYCPGELKFCGFFLIF